MTLKSDLSERGMDRLRDALEGVPEKHIEDVFNYVVEAFLQLAPAGVDPTQLSAAFDEALPSLVLPTVMFLTSVRDFCGEHWITSGGKDDVSVQ